nr:DNA integrity scanning diadenylate cyclase DisA [Nocardia stercoris]
MNVARLVPGTELRDGIDRILKARTGALIVLGYDEAVEAICDGGFELDVEFSATRLRELSKMDGAVVLSADGSRIHRASVHLVPDPALPTGESGTRHKAAERTGRQTGRPVIAVSRSTGIVTVFAGPDRRVLQSSETILARVNQALTTLERYRTRLDATVRRLTAVELADVATLRDVLTVLHCLELVHRLAREIAGDIEELGVDGRQVALQLAELVGDTDELRKLVVADYLRGNATSDGSARLDEDVTAALHSLGELPELALLESANLAAPLGFPATVAALDTAVAPRGHRVLAGLPRVSRAQARALVTAFGALRALRDASTAELAAVDGGDAQLAARVHAGLAGLAAG